MSFAWEIAHDSVIVNIVLRTMKNVPWSLATKSVSWKQKVLCDVMLHYVIGEHQAYIQRKMRHPILQLAKTMRGIHFLLDEIMCVQCQVYQ